MSRRFLQREELHVVTPYASPEIGDLGQGNHDVAIRIGRHVIDEIDNAVLQAANVESIDHMGNQRTLVLHFRHRESAVCRSAVSITSPAASAKAVSIASASPG